jgi:hypothetical protein
MCNKKCDGQHRKTEQGTEKSRLRSDTEIAYVKRLWNLKDDDVMN